MLESIRERWYAFTMEQKLSVVVLGMCGVFAVSLSLYRIRENVRSPFLVDKTQLLAAKEIIGLSTEEEQARLKRLDTDGDGLSDFDETNVFRTNPNLRDTCGDGIPDNVRVTTGRNLNCAGQRTNPTGYLDVSQVAATSSVFPVHAGSAFGGVDLGQLLQPSGASSPAQGAPTAAPTDVSQVLARDPAKIRESLQGRVDAGKLQSISDEDLLRIYDNSIEQIRQESEASSTTSTTQ